MIKMLNAVPCFLSSVTVPSSKLNRSSDLFVVNVMRMALKVVTVADIATMDGRRILHRAFLLKS